MVEFMNWTSDMSVGVNILDEDHKKLFDMINSLFVSDGRTNSRDHLGSLLEQLKDYTSFHFSREEDYMERCGYPALAEHKAAHTQFVEQVETLKKDFENNSEIMLRIDLILLLKDWLIEHIQTVDRQYGPFVNEQALQQAQA